MAESIRYNRWVRAALAGLALILMLEVDWGHGSCDATPRTHALHTIIR